MAKSTIPTTGLWSSIAGLINNNFTETYETPRYGIYDYNDLATSISPLVIPGTSQYVQVTNDGLGAFTNKTYGLPGLADIYNTTTNEFDFSSLSLGDSVDIRIDMEVTTSSPSQEIDLDMELATGSGSDYDILFFKAIFKNAGVNDIARFNSIYIGNNETKNFPARFKIRSDAAATAVVRGWYVRVMPRILRV